MIYRRFAILELREKIQESQLPKIIKVGNNEFVNLDNYASDNNKTTISIYSDIEIIIDKDIVPTIKPLISANKILEKRIEKAAALISIGFNSPKKLRSTYPTFALKAQNKIDNDYINELEDEINKIGFIDDLNLRSIYVSIDNQSELLFQDRFDGVISLSESLSVNTAISKFKELIRFFEIAYGATFSTLYKKIYKTIETEGLNYSRSEIQDWYVLRGGAVHGDRLRNKLVYENEVVHVIERMIQAAIIVLVRKKNWNKNDSEVRNEWIPPCRTDSQNKQTATANIEVWMDVRESRDGFGSWLFHGEKSINFNPGTEGWWLPWKIVDNN